MRIVTYMLLFLFGCILYVSGHPEPDPVYNPRNPPKIIKPTFNPNSRPHIIRPTYRPDNPPKFIRLRRFVDGNQNPPNQQKPEWEVKPDLSRDKNGNVNGEVLIQKHGKDHDLEAGWGQTIRGPNKHSETWHVGGSFRWP